MYQRILNSPFLLIAVIYLVLVAIYGGVLVLTARDLPVECQTVGGTELTLRTGEYFILDDMSILWSGVSFQGGPGSEVYWNTSLNVGEGFTIGELSYSEDGSEYYKWTIFRCGSDRFSVWETQNLLPTPPPAATPTPVAVIK